MNSGPLLPALPEGFGRAAEKLADTVRHVVDIAVGPDRIRAKAQAQADVAIIEAKGRAEIQEIEARAVERLRKREARRQQNIESITLKALDALPPPEQISGNPVSEDWTSRFFEECQDISDEQMQQIWARILADEITRPGSFSPRTLSIVRDLTKDDATLFSNLCRFVWIIPGAGPVPFVHDLDTPELLEVGIDFARLTHLTSIGLIEFDNIAGFKIKTPLKQIALSYCGKAHQLYSDGGIERDFSIGHAVFTAVGRELGAVAHAEGTDEYEKLALDEWKKLGWKEGEEVTAPEAPTSK